MAWFLLRRLGALILTLLLTSIVIFASMYLIPGDPAILLAGGAKATPERIAAVRVEFHLDLPPVERYLDWLGAALTGDFGRSLQYRSDVGELLLSRLSVSILLIIYAAILIIVGGIALGLMAALRGGTVDRMVLGFTSAAVATPSFVAAVLMIAVFAVGLRWFPASGLGEGFFDRLWHLTMPAIVLSSVYIALIARVSRTNFLASMRADHVTVARSRGVRESVVVRRHIVRNGLGPVLTLSGIIIAGLLVGATIAETAFGLNGVGALLRQSVIFQDLPVVQAISLLVVAAFLVCNTAVDIAYRYLDPRIADAEAKA